MHEELLRIAAELADREVGYPRWVSRSRAVSTAYYALFHALAELCARQLIGAWRPWPAFRHIYRSIEHRHVKQVFKALRNDRTTSDLLKSIGDSFSTLQEERHKADYDVGFRISRAEVMDLIGRSSSSIEALSQLSNDERKLLAALLIGRTRS